MNALIQDWLTRPIVQLLLIVVAIAGILQAQESVRALEKKAGGSERAESDLKVMAAEVKRLQAEIVEMEKSVIASGDILQSVQKVANAERLVIASTQGAGTKEAGAFLETLHSVRITGAALGPVVRLLNGLEGSHGGAMIRELTIAKSPESLSRKSITAGAKLDVEFVVGKLDRTGP